MNGHSAWKLSYRFLRVWQRNLTVYQRIWKMVFLPPLLEPIFYLVAFGAGLSVLVGTVQYQEDEVSYVAFIAPALLAINIMQNAFFETTYASFVRMFYQKTFDAMMATPLSLEEIMTGEIVWGATKSVMATCVMQAVVSLFGLVQYPEGLLIIPVAFVGGLAFGSIGLYFTAKIQAIETFNLPVFLFVTPMFLFGGTFFPLENLPPWAQWVAMAFPLTHVVNLTRSLCFGKLDPSLYGGFSYLVVFTVIFFPLAIGSMHRRLVK